MNPKRSKHNTKNFHDYAKSKSPKAKQAKTSARADGKIKTRREPLPMKLRALPRSFWQQPNRTAFASPGLICSRLPAIIKEDNESLLMTEEFKQPEFVSAANTELLFSLFKIIDEEGENRQRKFQARGRGRPRKLRKAKAKVIRDEDPYLSSNATEEFLPLLPTRSGADGIQINCQQVVTMLTSESSEPGKDYSHILSQLVVQL